MINEKRVNYTKIMIPQEFVLTAKPIIMILLPIIFIKIAARVSYRVWRLRWLLYLSWFVVLLPVWMTLGGIAGTAVYAMTEAAQSDETTTTSATYDNIAVKAASVCSDGQCVQEDYNLPIPTKDKPLKLSWYDPDLGGINCSPPCNMMASGALVTPGSYGQTAACVSEWMGATVVIKDYGEFKCLDTGGAIKEHYDFIWIDLLLHGGNIPGGRHVIFGTFVYEWELVWR